MPTSDDDDAFLELLRSGQFNAYLPGEHQLAEGRTLINVHPEFLCEGRGCSVHHPSDHKMKNWPKDFIFPEDQPGNWGHFMRYCQHRVAHPDPDDIVYWRDQRGRDITDHPCDGCCRDKREEFF